MSAIDGEDVHFCFGQFLRSLQKIPGGADRRADTQASLRILGGVRILQFFLDVFDRDQALEVVLIVDHEEFLDAVLVENLFRFLQRRAHGNGDEIFLGHHLVDGNVEAGFKAQVAVGEDADKLSVFGDRNAGNFVLAHDFKRVGNLVGGMHRDRIDDHATFRSLHLVDFIGLLLDGQVAMNDSEAALLRQCNRHVRFGHGVHGGAHDRNIQADVARELGLRVGLRGNNVGTRGQQQDIVKSKSLRNRKMNHKCLGIPRRSG